MYGISQAPSKEEYIMVLKAECCTRCNELCICEWCKQCQLDRLRKNFTKWTSGNSDIDKFIQEMQLKVNHHDDVIFEWIPFNQFNITRILSKNKSNKKYSATWKDGPLKFDSLFNEFADFYTYKYKRNISLEVTLKYFHDLQKVIDEV